MYWYEGSKIITLALALLTRPQRESVEELRLRVNRPVTAKGPDWQRVLDITPTRKDCEDYLAQLGGHSLYAAKNNLEQGFFTLEGGCRVGFCGRAVTDQKIVIAEPMFFNIRIAREIKTAARELLPLITQNGQALSTLILSPPGQGKTTLLRDALRRLSDGIGCKAHRVAIADERSEICGSVNGVPTLDVGRNTDVMDGGAKAKTMKLIIRTMAPDLIATDELGKSEDAAAVLDAARMGVKVIATVHGKNIADICQRLSMEELLEKQVFERIVSLKEKQIHRVWNAEGEIIWGGTHEESDDTGGISVLYMGRVPISRPVVSKMQ